MSESEKINEKIIKNLEYQVKLLEEQVKTLREWIYINTHNQSK